MGNIQKLHPSYFRILPSHLKPSKPYQWKTVASRIALKAKPVIHRENQSPKGLDIDFEKLRLNPENPLELGNQLNRNSSVTSIEDFGETSSEDDLEIEKYFKNIELDAEEASDDEADGYLFEIQNASDLKQDYLNHLFQCVYKQNENFPALHSEINQYAASKNRSIPESLMDETIKILHEAKEFKFEDHFNHYSLLENSIRLTNSNPRLIYCALASLNKLNLSIRENGAVILYLVSKTKIDSSSLKLKLLRKYEPRFEEYKRYINRDPYSKEDVLNHRLRIEFKLYCLTVKNIFQQSIKDVEINNWIEQHFDTLDEEAKDELFNLDGKEDEQTQDYIEDLISISKDSFTFRRAAYDFALEQSPLNENLIHEIIKLLSKEKESNFDNYYSILVKSIRLTHCHPRLIECALASLDQWKIEDHLEIFYLISQTKIKNSQIKLDILRKFGADLDASLDASRYMNYQSNEYHLFISIVKNIYQQDVKDIVIRNWLEHYLKTFDEYNKRQLSSSLFESQS